MIDQSRDIVTDGKACFAFTEDADKLLRLKDREEANGRQREQEWLLRQQSDINFNSQIFTLNIQK